jgi:DNA-binding IclR family transcriptional regulator
METDQSSRGSQAVRRVLQILHCWKDSPTLTLTQVAKATGLTMPTAHRMMRALQDEGFLVHDSANGQYGLGPAVTDLARVVLQRGEQDELPLVSTPHMERMRSISGETVGLHLPMADTRVCVAELVSRQPIRAATGVGRAVPLPAGAAGKVLVAWSPERLKMATRSLDAVPGELEAELALIKERGYAVSFGETIPGASALALPVFTADDVVVGAINVTGPENRWTEERMMAVLPQLREEVDQINLQLGHRPV